MSGISIPEKIYHLGIDWIFHHKLVTLIVMLLVFPLCFWFFSIIPKEKMPVISQNELMVYIEWNENIHLDENNRRTTLFLQNIQADIVESSASIGRKQYLLDKDREQTVSESEIYLKVPSTADLPKIKQQVDTYFKTKYPMSIVTYAPAGTIFERIFNTAEPDIRVAYQAKKRGATLTKDSVQDIQRDLMKVTGYWPTSAAFQKQLNLLINKEELLLYNVSYDQVYQALKAGFQENEVTTLRSYQQYLPITLSSIGKSVDEIIGQTMLEIPRTSTNQESIKVPLQTFIKIDVAEDIKAIVADRNGEMLPFDFEKLNHPDQTIQQLRNHTAHSPGWDIHFSGAFFSNTEMLGKLTIILFVSILLMYFILAAQFESFVQPLIVLLEIPIDIAAALGLLIVSGHSLNLMSAIGIVVTCGIIINDSILKVDIMNQLRKQGMNLMDAIHEAGRRRLNAILMTSLTAIVCLLPLLFSHNLGAELEKPLAIATIGGMVIGTPISLFVVPLAYWFIYRKKENKQAVHGT